MAWDRGSQPTSNGGGGDGGWYFGVAGFAVGLATPRAPAAAAARTAPLRRACCWLGAPPARRRLRLLAAALLFGAAAAAALAVAVARRGGGATLQGAQLSAPPSDLVCCGRLSPWPCATGDGVVGRPAPPPPTRRLRVAFLTYATGPYNAFVAALWASLQLHAFPRHDVHLHVFTDIPNMYDGMPNVHARNQTRLGWPFDSLGRHFLYLQHLDWLNGADYVFAIDSDAVVVGPLGEDMLGERVATLQAWSFGAPRSAYTYDGRLTRLGTPYSAGYIGPAEGSCYFAGGLFGGSLHEVRAILTATVALARSDLAASPLRVALWHDESYLNRVLLDAPPTLVLAPSYMYPEPPADEWLYVQPPPARDAWVSHGSTSRRFPRRILNLGVRKHLTAKVSEYQPLAARVPGEMRASGASAPFPLPPAAAHVVELVTFLVKAFERRACLLRLLHSLGRMYPGVRVLVLDDSQKPSLEPLELSAFAAVYGLQLRVLRAEFDVGLSEGRNRLVDAAETRYVLLLDGDFVMDTEAGAAGWEPPESGAADLPRAPVGADAEAVELPARGGEPPRRVTAAAAAAIAAAAARPPGPVVHLLQVLESGAFDIAGGCVASPQGSTWSSYSMVRGKGGKVLRQTADVSCADAEPPPRAPDYSTPEVSCWSVDRVLNFFMARTEFLATAARWDPVLKVGEHEDFPLRARDAWARVAMCRGVTATKDKTCAATHGPVQVVPPLSA